MTRDEAIVLRHIFDHWRRDNGSARFVSAESLKPAFDILHITADTPVALEGLHGSGLLNAQGGGVYTISRQGVAVAQRLFG